MSLGTWLRVAFFVLAGTLVLPAGAAPAGSVIVGEEKLVLATYTLARKEPAPPLFPQYDSGLYPYASFDRTTLSRTPETKTYRAIVLENEYLRVTLVPRPGWHIPLLPVEFTEGLRTLDKKHLTGKIWLPYHMSAARFRSSS